MPKIENANLEMLVDIEEVEKSAWGKRAASKESLKKRIDIFSDGFLVAVLDGKIVGIINGCRLKNNHKIETFRDLKPFESVHDKNGSIFYIYSIGVRPNYRNRGVARELIRKIIEVAKNMPGIEKIWIVGGDVETKYTIATAPVYKRYGFRIIEKLPKFLEKKPSSLLEMKL